MLCPLFILDYHKDGQLGFDGGNSATPCLLKQFLELESPESLTEESGSKSKGSLKVCRDSLLVLMNRI